MPWLGIWFEHEAREGAARSPEWFEGFVPPVVYPYAHGFIEAEEKRLTKSKDPSTAYRDGERFSVYYSLAHDGGQSGLDQQGCRILNWLFGHFSTDVVHPVSARFNEIPVVVHEPHPVKAAALGNALTLLRFLVAEEDQAVAKILLHPWQMLRGGPRLTALEYEKRVLDFLHGELFYPEGITMFDVLERRDLKAHRELAACCETQIGFIRFLLEWIDDCWPGSEDEASELQAKLRNSLADEAHTWRQDRARRRRTEPTL